MKTTTKNFDLQRLISILVDPFEITEADLKEDDLDEDNLNEDDFSEDDQIKFN